MEKTEQYEDEGFTLKNIGKVVLNRFVRVVVSFAIVTIGFLLTDTPIFATGAAVLAWVLTGMFVSVSSCLLASGEKS